MVRIIVKAVPTRVDFIFYLKEKLPQAEFCMDERSSAFDTFLRALKMAGNDSCVHMEEDVILTKEFYKKITNEINKKPLNFIQFFSMRQKDIIEGSRWDNNFLMNQCWYAPPTYSAMLLDYFENWRIKNLSVHPSGTDTMVCDFLKSRREKYWIHCPSLVDHRVSRSVIDPRRSSKRQSLTFVDPI
tara:strand:- start:368 stop:925 length:558 start_codon:yes stop_codon:yes gene_type:complete